MQHKLGACKESLCLPGRFVLACTHGEHWDTGVRGHTCATVRFNAVIQASELRAYMSAPVKVGGHFSAMTPRSISGSITNLRVRACSTFSLEWESSATPTYSSTSRRPGRSRAGSIRSGLHTCQTQIATDLTAPRLFARLFRHPLGSLCSKGVWKP